MLLEFDDWLLLEFDEPLLLEFEELLLLEFDDPLLLEFDDWLLLEFEERLLLEFDERLLLEFEERLLLELLLELPNKATRSALKLFNDAGTGTLECTAGFVIEGAAIAGVDAIAPAAIITVILLRIEVLQS